MVKKFKFIVLLVFAASVIYGQDLPRTITNRHTLADWVRNGTFNLANKTYVAPTLSGLLTHTNTSAATSGTIRSSTITQTHTGDGAAILEALRVDINSAVQTGQWSNAIVGAINYSGAAGDAGGGLAAAMCAEVTLPAIASPAGSYFAHDLEFNAPTTYEANSGSGFNVAYLRFGLYGNATAIASFEDEAYFMKLSTDFTDASGNMWYDNTLRMQIETTDWFIPLSDAEGEYSSAYQIDISNITDATGTTDGSIATDGGMGVAKKLFVGTDLAVDGTSNLDDVDIDGTVTADGTVFSLDATTSFNMDNTNASNGISINTATSAGVVSIGHTTSETTVNDNLTVTGDADVVGALTGNTIVSDGNVGGTTGTFTDEVDITKSTAGIGLDVNYTATSFTDLMGAVDVRRTGALTGVDADYIFDVNVLPAFTFTEPGAGTAYYYGGNIDMTSAAVTAGAGSSVLTALKLTAGTDNDAGANWALQTTGNVEITGATLAVAAQNAVNIIATTSITSGSNYAVEISHTNTAGSTANLGALFATTTAGAAGSGFMGLMSRVDMDTYNASTGGANALYGEILLPDAAQNGGEYHVAVLTLAESGAGFVPINNVTIPTSFMKYETWGGAAEHMDDYAYLWYTNGFTAAADHLISLTSQTARVNIGKVARYMVLSQMQDGLGLGVTGTRMVLTANTDQAIEVFTTSPTTTGNHWANQLHHQNSATTTGTQGVLWVENDVVAQAGGQNAGYFKIDMNAIQAPTGGVSVLNLEMVMPTGTQNGGEYHALVIDVDCPSGTDLVLNDAIPISFMKLEVYGDTDDEFNECASLFYLSGVVDTEGGIFESETVAAGNADFTHVLKINIGHTPYYIGLNTSKAF